MWGVHVSVGCSRLRRRARSAHRRARMTAEEKQLQNQARHARRQRAKAAGLAGLEDPPGADPARVEGTLGGDDE